VKVLLITPYSPLTKHDHAANDLALPLVKALAPLMELHVYAPGQENGLLKSWVSDGITFHSGSPVKRNQIDRLSKYPYAARGSWSHKSTVESIALVHRLNPDVLHAEYLQAAEPLLQCAKTVRTSLTLHDVWANGRFINRGENGIVHKFLQLLEHAKTKRFMDKVLNRVNLLIVFSEHDKQKILRATGIVKVLSVGVNKPLKHWVGDLENVAAFGGALWRSENESAAVYLACNVLPLVRQMLPSAELRIFGALPSDSVRALGNQPGVTVVGEVEDYDDEFRHAAVTLAPTLVEAGVLLKAIRAMSLGAPVVLNTASARPIAGLINGVHALVADDPTEYAAQVVKLMQRKENARELGKNGRDLVNQNFNWERTADAFHRAFEQLLSRDLQ
jgi:glycosyltransferase involved in cell wall biosynthesis